MLQLMMLSLHNVKLVFAPVQVKQLAAYLTQREGEGEPTFRYTQATVTK